MLAHYWIMCVIRRFKSLLDDSAPMAGRSYIARSFARRSGKGVKPRSLRPRFLSATPASRFSDSFFGWRATLSTDSHKGSYLDRCRGVLFSSDKSGALIYLRIHLGL